MTTRKYSSISQETTLTSGISTTATTMVVGSSLALLGGVTLSGTETFVVVIDPDTALEEIVEVVYPSSSASNTLTIVRGVDGSGTYGVSGIAHSAGAAIRHMGIGRDFREANTHIEGNLTQHAATTSAQLASVISDETGTGSLVFNTSPTIVTPTIASFANATHNHTNAAGGGTITSAAISDFQEAVEDTVGAMVSGNSESGISVTYDDATGKYNFDVNDPVISIDGDIAGSATMTNLGNVTINTGITAGVIVNADISGSAAIAASKIAGTAITAADTGTVTSTMIANGTIVDADINSAAAIDKTKISGTAITAADTGTVTSTMIADGTITNADINASAAIAKTKLDLGGTITSADLVDGTIVNSDINASAGIALSKLATDPLARANHTGTQTSSTISDFDTQVRSSRLDQMAQPTFDMNFNAKKITNLADPTNAQDAVTLNYITNQKGAANGLASLDGTGKLPTSQLPGIAVHTTFVVASQAAMLAVSGADEGDLAVRTDLNKTFILTATPASTLGNWQELLTPTDSVTSVDGNTGAVSLTATYLAKAGGTMAGALAMGNNKITGLGTPTATGDAATKDYVDTVAGSTAAAQAAQAAAEAVYDNFDDRYLGAKSSAPTLDNDGNALLTGAIYWNTSTNAMYAWTGTEWGSISSTAAIFRYKFLPSAGATSVSGADANGVTLAYLPGKEQVYLNGVLLVRDTDYTASNGTSITSISATASGDVLEVITFTSFELATAIDKTILDAKGDLIVASGADTPGKLTAGTNGYFLQADSTQALGLKWAAVDLSSYLTSATAASTYATQTTVSTNATTESNNTMMNIMGAY